VFHKPGFGKIFFLKNETPSKYTTIGKIVVWILKIRLEAILTRMHNPDSLKNAKTAVHLLVIDCSL
jgi:hypothetical protein